MRSFPVSLALAACIAAGSARAADCPGDAGYQLIVSPEEVPLGSPFITTVVAPQNAVVVLLVSGSEGPTPTAYGPLCVGLPLHGALPFVMPLPSVSFAHFIDCWPGFIGLEGHMQFLAVDPLEPGVVHVSNSASFGVVDGDCLLLQFAAGDFATFTMGGWGTNCSGNNPGCRRDQFFAQAFPNGLVIGDQDGIDGDGAFSLVLSTSKAVEDFLPSGGTAGKLTADVLNPTSKTSAGVLAGQLVAAKLNSRFDDLGFMNDLKDLAGVSVSDLVYVAGVHPKLIDRTVNEVIAIADKVVSGAFAVPYDVDGDSVGDVDYADLAAALDALNMNFVEGNTNLGMLGAP